MCGHSFDIQKYLNGLVATIDELKTSGAYPGNIRDKEITFFIRGCSGTSAIADMLKYFPNARFIASSANGETGTNNEIHKNILA